MIDLKNFENKTALITGGASGIGLAIAQKATTFEMNVVLVDTNGESLSKVKDELNWQAGILIYKCDVTNYSILEDLSEKIILEFGAIDLLFNNAGIGIPKDMGAKMWEVDFEDVEKTMEINLLAPMKWTQHFLPLLEKNEDGGHIINTASALGILTRSVQSVYSTSKHAIFAFSENLFLQLKASKSKVGVSVLAPGPVKTDIIKNTIDLNKEKFDQMDPTTQKEIVEYGELLEKSRDPSEIAEMCFVAIENQQFYIFPDNWIVPTIRKRFEMMITDLNPEDPF